MVFKHCLNAVLYMLRLLELSYFQEPHQESVRKDEFFLTDDKSDIQVFLIIIEFHNLSFAEFLVDYGTSSL